MTQITQNNLIVFDEQDTREKKLDKIIKKIDEIKAMRDFCENKDECLKF